MIARDSRAIFERRQIPGSTYLSIVIERERDTIFEILQSFLTACQSRSRGSLPGRLDNWLVSLVYSGFHFFPGDTSDISSLFQMASRTLNLEVRSLSLQPQSLASRPSPKNPLMIISIFHEYEDFLPQKM